MSVILDALPREWRQPVGRVGAGFAIGSVTGVVGGFVPILQEFVVEMKVPDAAKKLGPIGIARQMGNGGISLGTFFGLFQGTTLLIDNIRGEHDYGSSIGAAGLSYFALHRWHPMRANKWWALVLVGLDLYHEWKDENDAEKALQGPGW